MLTIRTRAEAHKFLSAILSRREERQIRKRWYAYQLRAEGKSLARIVRQAHIAMATATRTAALHRKSSKILDTLIRRAERKTLRRI